MPSQIKKIITQHVQYHPKLQIQDLYKLLFQAAMGIEHLLQDPAPILNYLIQEIDEIESTPTAKLAEAISSKLIRLHLEPFKARKGQPEQIVQIMFKTAKNFEPSKQQLISYWNELEQLADEKIIPFSPTELSAFFHSQKQAGLPAVHHSQVFREQYRPAYRVILKKFLTELHFTA